MTTSALRLPRATKAPDEGRHFLYLCAVVGMYAVVNSASIRLSSTARIVYALVLVFIVAAFVSQLLKSRGRTNLAVPLGLGLWSLFIALEAIQIPSVPYAHLSTSVSDVLIALSPLLVFLLVRAWGPSDRSVAIGLGIVATAALVGSVIAWQRSGGARFEAPPIVAVAGFWAFATMPIPEGWFAPRLKQFIRVCAWVAVFGLLPVILASRSRTSLGVWGLCGLLLILLPGAKRARRSTTILVGTLVGSALWLIFGAEYASKLIGGDFIRDLRIQDFLAGRLDASSESRLSEVRDAIRTMNQEGGFLERILGFGPGASYEPALSHIATNIDDATGRVHNIHVTPVTVWFRYGWLGLIAFAGMMASVLLSAIRNYRARPGLLSALLLAMAVAYMSDLIVRNSTADPVFSLMIGVIFVQAERRTKETS